MSSSPQDLFGRPISDLRISVTDRCNFRCGFCMPAHQKYQFLPKGQILSFEEILRLTTLFVRLGARKVRLTGGEPLLRAEIESLVSALASLPGVEDLALTTNGYRLAEKAPALAAAGLRRLTLSLHSLDPTIFGQLNGLDLPLEVVLQGLEAALQAGLQLKINMVVMKGVNDHEIVEMARFARDHAAVIRFIEYMDVGTVNAWDPARVVSAREILERIDADLPIENLERRHPGEVAERWRYRDGSGELGVITSVTQPFCGDCSRARLSADGRLYTCLFGAIGHDLKTPLRAGVADEVLLGQIVEIWERRRDRYSEERTAALRAGLFSPAPKVEMFRIGG